MTNRHGDEPPDPIGSGEAPGPAGKRAPIMTNDVYRLGYLERVE